MTCDICNPNHPLVIASKKLLLPIRNTTPDNDVGGWDEATLALVDETILDSTPLSSVSSTLCNTTPNYDVGGWDDATLALLHESILDVTPSSSVSNTQVPALLPAPPHLQVNSTPRNSVPGPSMSLRLDQALYLRLQQDKRGKIAELSSMTKALGGILDGSNTDYCVICWAWKNKWVLKTPRHQYFISCKTQEDCFV